MNATPVIHHPLSPEFTEFYISAPVFGLDDDESTLQIKVTSEGLIIDLVSEDEVVLSWGGTYQEMADNILGP